MKKKINLPPLRVFLIIAPVSLLNALFFDCFYVTNGIAIGGITGISQVINLMTGFPIGILIFCLNIPLFFMGWRFLGGSMLVSSLFTMLCNSVGIDLFNTLIPFQPIEPLLACIYGGVLNGVTMGVILRQGASFGGSDLASRLLKLKIQWLPVGRLMLGLDLVIITSAALISRNLDSAMYGMVTLYISSMVMDNVIYGLDKSDVAYIISEKYEEIAQNITENLHRGVTLLEGRGAWSGMEKQVLMVAFKQRQVILIKELVKDIDPNAFLIVCPAHEVLGIGFHMYKKNEL